MSLRPGEETQHEVPAVAPPPIAYVATLVVYLVLGYLFRSVVLNWIIGPTFLVCSLYTLPRLLGRRGPKAAG